VSQGLVRLAGTAVAGVIYLFPQAIHAQVMETGGVVVLEAENYDANLSPRSSHQWQVGNIINGYSGSSYMEALPNNGAILNAGSTSPELPQTGGLPAPFRFYRITVP
jgi:hypothetical protein